MGKISPLPRGVAVVSVQCAPVWQLSLIAYQSSVADVGVAIVRPPLPQLILNRHVH